MEGRADSPVQFICWYVKHSGMHARLQKPALGDEKRERDVRDADELYEEYRQFCVEMKKEAVDFLGFARSVLVEFHPLVDYRVVEGAQQFLICREEMKGSLWASRLWRELRLPAQQTVAAASVRGFFCFFCLLEKRPLVQPFF